MDQIINLAIPHIGEKIFQNIGTENLIEFLSVSKTWKVLAGNVLFKRRHKDQIFYACIDAPLALVEILVERSDTKELNVKKRDPGNEHGYGLGEGHTPLMIACKYGRHDVVKVLLEYSERKAIELNSTNCSKMNAFMIACSYGHTDIVKTFLDYQGGTPINVNAQSYEGWTGFMSACGGRHQDVIKLLMDYSESKSIDLNAKTNHGTTAFMTCCASSKYQPVKFILDYPNNHSIDFNARCTYEFHEDMSPFMFACRYGNTNIVKLIIDYSESKSIDLNARTKDGETAFDLACQFGKIDVVQLLLDHPNEIHYDINEALKLQRVSGNRERRTVLENHLKKNTNQEK